MIPFEIQNDTKAGNITLEEQITSDEELERKYGPLLFQAIYQKCPIEERKITSDDLVLVLNSLKPDIYLLMEKDMKI